MSAVILFDFGGTLDWPAHWLDRFLAHSRAAGLEVDRATLDHAFKAATGFGYRTADRMRELGLEGTVHYHLRHQLAALRESNDHLRATIDELGAERLETAISTSFVSESRDGLGASRAVLEPLAQRYQLGIVSNFYGNLDRILDEAGMLSLFAFVADSSRLGIFKPDKRIFSAALDSLDARAATTLMVGDSLDKDCAPARALGMSTVWLRHRVPGHYIDPQMLAEADFTIDTLVELQHLRWTNG
jgi:putative hydrolase of the HAD superfamily